MTKKEIVKKISEEYHLTQLKTKEIVQATFDAIIQTLVTEGRIELRNFGVFEVKRRKPRRARNPRTNEEVQVDAKNVVTFQPGKVMEEKVRKMTARVPDETPSRGRKGEVLDDDGDDDLEDLPLANGAPTAKSPEYATVGAGAAHADADPLKPR